MTNIIHVIPEPPNIKNNIKKVEKRIKEASDEISKAKKELNNANHSELSYEINQLESMYKKTNQYASEFETFASKVETMVNEYITADKNCANKIRSNGKSHRQKTGLPKGLGAALISSSFEKLGDIIDDINDTFKKWVDEAVDWLKDIPIIGGLINSIYEDFDSWTQLASSILTGVACLTIIAAAPVGGPLALAMAIGASISYLMKLDQFTGAIVDIFNLWETDGDSITQSIFGDKYDEFYNAIDYGLDLFLLNGLNNAIKNLKYVDDLDKVDDMANQLAKIDDLDNLTNFKTLKNLKKWLDNTDKVDKISMWKKIITGDFEGATEIYVKGKVTDALV